MTNALHNYFEARRSSVCLARRFVLTTLASWGISGESAEDIRLCVSELVTNALVHGTRRGHGFLVRLCADGDGVRLEVHDSRDAGPGSLPCVHTASDTDITGRGLWIVRSLADDWGVENRAPYGKVVWSRFKAVPEMQPADQPASRTECEGEQPWKLSNVPDWTPISRTSSAASSPRNVPRRS
ncbi:anti-sigma regulatory factor (Ser/Thr protein kinase) [Streptomyces sp. 840.1]|uniref:ATP-binding protein n=1 Tax=Streptomyces sp. 840.1 TaxID=2485152 RepID=UPI000F487A19|nr:ATP-binding protein [Streptomyces sp. 840.1]ROQ68238.1 anti-sigma regulatory factor (Ser/Thr protein kinase) [Streptomyces sp. 840.1]